MKSIRRKWHTFFFKTIFVSHGRDFRFSRYRRLKRVPLISTISLSSSHGRRHPLLPLSLCYWPIPDPREWWGSERNDDSASFYYYYYQHHHCCCCHYYFDVRIWRKKNLGHGATFPKARCVRFKRTLYRFRISRTDREISRRNKAHF